MSGDPIEEIIIVPAHVMTLATTPGGRKGYYFFIDTERGTITIMDFQQGLAPTELTRLIASLEREIVQDFSQS